MEICMIFRFFVKILTMKTDSIMNTKTFITLGLVILLAVFLSTSCSDKGKMGSYRKNTARENASSKKRTSYESKKPRGKIPVSGNYRVREKYSGQ